jgi:hypothetical protein
MSSPSQATPKTRMRQYSLRVRPTAFHILLSHDVRADRGNHCPCASLWLWSFGITRWEYSQTRLIRDRLSLLDTVAAASCIFSSAHSRSRAAASAFCSALLARCSALLIPAIA